jgi:hypothetical protein
MPLSPVYGREWQALWATDPAGFYLGMYRGEIVGAAAAIVVDPTFASSGMITIKPEYRRMNCGALIFSATFDTLNQARRLHRLLRHWQLSHRTLCDGVMTTAVTSLSEWA